MEIFFNAFSTDLYFSSMLAENFFSFTDLIVFLKSTKNKFKSPIETVRLIKFFKSLVRDSIRPCGKRFPSNVKPRVFEKVLFKKIKIFNFLFSGWNWGDSSVKKNVCNLLVEIRFLLLF